MQNWETDLIDKVESAEGWKLINKLSNQMRCMPEDVCKGANLIVDALEASGIETVVHKPKLYLGIPVSATISFSNIVIDCKASALSPAVQELTAPIVHLEAQPSQQGVHLSDPARLFKRTFETIQSARDAVLGRVVVTEGLSNPARTQLLQSWGAVAVIAINPGDRSHWGTNSTVWGSPVRNQINDLPQIASVAVSRQEGNKILNSVKHDEEVTLKVDALHGWFEQPVITAEIKGEGPEADDFVLLHGHYDSWEFGVGDNATGNAVLLEVARAFSKSSSSFRRTVKFAWWPGHSAGRYAGSSWYADAFGAELDRSCIAHVNCDSPGCADATSYASIRSMVEAEELVKRSINDLFGQLCTITRPGRAGDYSFNNLGITGTMLTSSMVPKEERDRRGWYAVGGCGGSPAWHSEYDVFEVADQNILRNDTKLYALITARLANDEYIPLDYRATLIEIRDTIEAIDSKQLKIQDRENLVNQLSTIIEKLEAYVGSNLISNTTVKTLSRAVVRLNFAIGPSHEQDPARSFKPVPLLSNFNSADETDIQYMRRINAASILLRQMISAFT